MEIYFEKIICENDYIFEESSLELFDNNKRSFDEITRFLKSQSKCLVVQGKKAWGKSVLVKKALLENISSFSRVYYIEYDKEKYLNIAGKTKPLSIDQVLKKNIFRLFLSKGMCSVKDDVLEHFEKSLDENTLLVVDNYDFPSFSPYLRHLLKQKCKMIVVTRGDFLASDKQCRIIQVNSVNAAFINPLCEKLKKSVCKYLKITFNEFDEKLGFEKVTENLDDTNAFLLKLYSVCNFDEQEKELLRTLGAMLFYLSGTTEIKSSKQGVFDVNSVKYYLGNLSLKLEKLIFLGFVNVSQNGTLYFDRAVLEFVMNCLLPDAENCPTFVSFVKKSCDFTVVQSVKDTDALLYTYGKKDYEDVLNLELLETYTHFLKTDENKYHNVYNILICNTLENYKNAGVYGYINHLMWQNKSAYFSVLYEALSDEGFLENLYDFDERYNLYCDAYSENVLAKLDLLRIAGGILNGVPKQTYFDFEICFDIIDKTLGDVLEIATDKSISFDDRMSLLYDAIRIVYELFSYCSVFDKEACTYNKRRSLSSKELVQSTSIAEIDNIKAVSINMAYSIKTVKLYGAFQRLLYEYKRCADVEDLSHCNSFYKLLALQKKNIVNTAFCNISSEYSRIIKGYDRFYDFFEKENMSIKIWQRSITDDELGQKLNDCKRLSIRGFDDGTKTGGVRFAKDVIMSLDKTKNATYLVSVILSQNFEINDNTYIALLKSDFASKVLCSKNISKTDKALLLEYCIDCLCENDEKAARFELILSVVRKLMSALTLSRSEKERICERLCFAYLKALAGEQDASKTKKLFYEYFIPDYMPEESAVCCFVYAYMCYDKKQDCNISNHYLSEAAKTVAFENMHRESKLNLQGYLNLVREVCGEKCADEIHKDIEKMFCE